MVDLTDFGVSVSEPDADSDESDRDREKKRDILKCDDCGIVADDVRRRLRPDTPLCLCCSLKREGLL